MSHIDEAIRKAIEDGQFDNLPGKGKPLKLEHNPFENPEWRLAYSVLKNSGFTLPWIEERQEIEEAIDKAQAALTRAWDYHRRARERNQPEALIHNEWQRAVEAYQARIAEINPRILRYNLTTPSIHFHRLVVDADQEIKRLTQTG